jgi:transcriptional regulator with XRE-family HTH domain
MNQPDLGVKVAELRQQKGLTQEQLAEQCEVSPRTIQRIESGEVDPRAYTLQCLSKALEFDFATEISSNENLWLALLHLSSIICIIIIPLLLWSWKKSQSYKINQQGRHVLNFQITMALTLIVALFVLMIFPITLAIMQETSGLDIIEGNPVIMALLIALPLPLIFIGIFCTYQGVVNAMRSLSDKPIHYPLSIPFVR